MQIDPQRLGQKDRQINIRVTEIHTGRHKNTWTYVYRKQTVR